MGSPLNPIASGLMAGFQLAHQIKGERMAQQQLDRQKQQDEESKQIRDLQTQMALSDRGYKPSTPDQEAELMTGLGIGRAQVPYGPTQAGNPTVENGGDGPPTIQPSGSVPQSPVRGVIGGVAAPVRSDIKQRAAKFNGQNYVRASDEEMQAKADAQNQREQTQKNENAVSARQSMVDAFALPVTDPSTGKTIKVLPSEYAGVARGLKDAYEAANPKATEADKERMALKAITPDQWGEIVDHVISPKSMIVGGKPFDTSALNQRTKAQVAAALKMGLPGTAIHAVIKDASDQIGRTETGVRTAESTKATKIEIAGATTAARNAASMPTDAGLDMMGEEILNGKPPSSRNPVVVARAYSRAAEMARDRGLTNQQVILERNAATANKGALNTLTKQMESVEAFSQTAEKNMKVAEDKFKELTDLGAPFFDTPIRDIQKKFFGDRRVPAAQAALQTAQAEITRVLNSANATGVLSDTARHEIQALLPTGATAGQLKDAFDVFRTDIKNRRDTYKAQIADLSARTTVGSTGTTGAPAQQQTAAPAATAATAATSAATGQIAVISPEGVPGFIPADKWDAAQKRGFKRQ